MISSKPLDSSSDISGISYDFARMLALPQNADIAIDFPDTVRRYSEPFLEVKRHLQDTVLDCKEGKREQFVGYYGMFAVGMSVIRLTDHYPEGAPSHAPNVSLFVCNPFRHKGIGRMLLQESLKTVADHFGGEAWTEVRSANTASNNLVRQAGFVPTSDIDDKITYTYSII